MSQVVTPELQKWTVTEVALCQLMTIAKKQAENSRLYTYFPKSSSGNQALEFTGQDLNFYPGI